MRDLEGALKDFNSAINLSPKSAHIYFNRANLYASIKDYFKAVEDYTKGTTWIAVFPTNMVSPLIMAPPLFRATKYLTTKVVCWQ